MPKEAGEFIFNPRFFNQDSRRIGATVNTLLHSFFIFAKELPQTPNRARRNSKKATELLLRAPMSINHCQ
jgi:hypothetical protein